MGLQDLNEDIYRRDYENAREARSEYAPGKGAGGNIGFGSERWKTEVPSRWAFLSKFVKWKWFFAALPVVAVIGVVMNFASIRAALFSDERVSIGIIGPKEVASAETVRFSVQYGNGNMLPMKDVELAVSFPESFRIDAGEGVSVGGNTATFRLGDLEGRSFGEVPFSGKFYGAKGSLAYLKATIRFAPSGMSSRFDREAQVGVTIASSPLAIEISSPQEIASGNEIEYVFAYRNDSDLSFSNLRIKAEYPQDFRFSSSEPRASDGDASWRLGNLLPHTTGEIRVRGTVSGHRDEAKVMRVSLGVLQGDDTFLAYDRRERLTRIVASPLSITQTVNGKTDISVKPGDMLTYDIRYSNEGALGLRDVIITVEADTSLLDMVRLRTSGGSYDSARGLIVWKAPDFPGLARLEPGQGGSLSFSVPVRTDVGVSGEAGKHFTVRTIAKIDSPDIPFSSPTGKVIASNALEVRIGSVVGYDVLGYYHDEALPNAGPTPPKSGVETTYTIRLKVTNYLNDLSQAKTTITLPTGVRYTGKKLPESEALSYNERIGQLVWNIGNIWGGGKTVKEIAFQVSLTPGPNEIGSAPKLLLGSVFEAEDAFAKNSIRLERGPKTTALTEDLLLGQSHQAVVP